MTRTFDPAAWTAWRQSEVDKAGNGPAGWIAVARNLLTSGGILESSQCAALAIMLRDVRRTVEEPQSVRTPEDELIVRVASQTHNVSLMLYGFAVECLLKATYLKRGGVLYRSGKYASPKRLAQSHNLAELAEALECSSIFSDEQLDILDLLSARNEMGRYPTHSHYQSYGIQPPTGEGFSRFYGIWSPAMSAQVFEVFQALYSELGEELPETADALLESSRIQRCAYTEGSRP